MFESCLSLKTLDVSHFCRTKLQDAGWMFSGLASLRKLNLTGWTKCNPATDYKFGMIYPIFTNPYSNLLIIWNEHDQELYFPSNEGINEAKYSFNVADYREDENDILNHQETDNLIYFFPKNKEELINIIKRKMKTNLYELDLSDVNVSNITDMSKLFYGEWTLEKIDFSDWDTSNVTNMDRMFYGCRGLKKLDLSSFDTSNVTEMKFMFCDCESLKELDLSNFETSNVNTMQSMFGGCKLLKTLNMSSFDTSNVRNMFGMFCSCRELTDIDVSNFNTSNVRDMGCMFKICGITKLDLSNFDTSNVINMGHMFEYCGSLKKLDLSNFNIYKVNNAEKIFNDCISLEEVDLSGWKKIITAQNGIVDITDIFKNCKSLKKLYLGGCPDYYQYYYTTLGILKTTKIIFERVKHNWISESVHNFDVTDYADEEDDVLNTQETNKLVYTYFPKNKEELINIIREKIKENEFGDNNTVIPNLYDIDTSKITDMSELFFNVLGNDWSCTEYNEKANKVETFISSALRSDRTVNIEKPVKLDLSNWNVSSVKTMEKMFYKCTTLTEVDVSNWDTSNVQTM